MSTYYTGKRAKHYNTRWHKYSVRMLEETLVMIDMSALHSIQKRLGRCPRVLDVACGTGILLQRLLAQLPDVEAYGIDVSEDMLAQAQIALKDMPNVHLERVKIGAGVTANLPYAQETFDLITCTNALHDMPEPTGVLSGLKRLLASGGQLVVEDFAPREPRFFWTAFEWLLQRIEKSRVHAYTLTEAQALCQQARLHVVSRKVSTVGWLWHGWVVRANRTAPEVGPVRT